MLQWHSVNDFKHVQLKDWLTSVSVAHKPEYLEVQCQLGRENHREQPSCDGTHTALQCDHVLVSV